MDITNNTNLSTQLEAQVLSIEPDFITLEIQQTGQKILWPRRQSPPPYQIGDKFLLELNQQQPKYSIQSIVSKAKDKKTPQDTEQMRRFLEELIN